MLPEKKVLYKKAYVELYELIKVLPREQFDRLPSEFIDYVCEQRNENYTFKIDNSKPLLEQNYMIETKALIVKMYEKYIAGENEREFWNKYDQICNNMIEREKQKKYDVNNIFQNDNIEHKSIEQKEKNVENLPQTQKKKNIFKRILDFFKKMKFKIKF